MTVPVGLAPNEEMSSTPEIGMATPEYCIDAAELVSDSESIPEETTWTVTDGDVAGL